MSLPLLIKAALYVRASTEHQNYSTDHQEAAIREYAAQYYFEVVASYRDQGRSGLTLDGRHGLLQLLNDVQSGQAKFATVLVYDVSRWGRFQDIDESAYYEFACRRAGIAVAYCAEPFTNDGSPLATVLKGLKRAMAAEFSRELSAKVWKAQCRLTAAGFKQGGSAGYGLRRLCISASGEPRRVLEGGERKSLPTDRVIFVHGPQDEVAVVRRVFHMCSEQRMPDTAIAEQLNAEGLRNQYGRPWSSHNVKGILTNEKYTGTLIFNRSTQRLRSSRRPNDKHKWIRLEGAFDGIVSTELFSRTKEVRRRRLKHWTDDEMLDALRDILVAHGTVTSDLIDASNAPSAKSYALRFRGLVGAFEAAGVSESLLTPTAITRFRVRCVTRDMSSELERCADQAGAPVERLTQRTYRLKNVVVRILCTRCRYERSHPCWKVTLRYDVVVDFVIWVRMDEVNKEVAQIYLIPVASFPNHQFLWPSTATLAKYEKFSCKSIPEMFGLS